MNFVQIIFSEVRYHRFDFRFDCEYTSHTRNTKDNFLLQAIISRRILILNTLNATCVNYNMCKLRETICKSP